MFQMLGVFAEFERGIIRERVNAGLARAKANGTKLGRRRVAPGVEAQILELRERRRHPQDRPKAGDRDERGAARIQRGSGVFPLTILTRGLAARAALRFRDTLNT